MSQFAAEFTERMVRWYDAHARDLPWRRSGTGAWAILVSEFMLQQTPVSRVISAWTAWVARWPTPRTLATDSPAEAVRMWGRLGYPRRALRLYECAATIVDSHGGIVPNEVDTLLLLPGVGTYTARAIAAFAYQRRAAAVDVNVRRVLARAVRGVADAESATTTRDIAAMEQLLPDDGAHAARLVASTMELGATVCATKTPSCAHCPLATRCAWRAAGYPAYYGPPRRKQGYEGTDRQARGRLLALLREAFAPVPAQQLETVWPNEQQRVRALESLLADGLAMRTRDDHYTLPI